MARRTESRQRLSDTEWLVMLALWRLGTRASVADVQSQLDEDPPRNYRTIQTFLTRCAEKGYVEVSKAGGRQYYSAAVRRADAVRERIREFLTGSLQGDPEDLRIAQEEIERALAGRG